MTQEQIDLFKINWDRLKKLPEIAVRQGKGWKHPTKMIGAAFPMERGLMLARTEVGGLYECWAFRVQYGEVFPLIRPIKELAEELALKDIEVL